MKLYFGADWEVIEKSKLQYGFCGKCEQAGETGFFPFIFFLYVLLVFRLELYYFIGTRAKRWRGVALERTNVGVAKRVAQSPDRKRSS